VDECKPLPAAPPALERRKQQVGVLRVVVQRAAVKAVVLCVRHGHVERRGERAQDALVARVAYLRKSSRELGLSVQGLNSVSAFPGTLISSKSRVYLPKDGDPVGLPASRSVGV